MQTFNKTKSKDTNNKSTKSIVVMLVLIVLTISLAMGTALAFSGCAVQFDPKVEMQTKSIDKLKVGIIGDSHLPNTVFSESKKEQNTENLRRAFKILKYRNVNMIVFTGDVAEYGADNGYDNFNAVAKEVFGTKMPLMQMVMGERDYMSPEGENSLSKIEHQTLFQDKLGTSPWSHYKVNGYHFIACSPTSSNVAGGYAAMTSWLDKTIASAQSDTPDKPIFVTTHTAPKNTVFGSSTDGNRSLSKVFAKYSNVVNITGHTHYSIIDERSLWQEDYTVINSQATSVFRPEKGYENTAYPNAEKIPMGYIMDMSSAAKIEILRYEFIDGAIGSEIKQSKRWTLPLPYAKDKFQYTAEKRADKNTTPVFNQLEYSEYNYKDNVVTVKFDAAKDDDFIYGYKVVIDGKKTILLLSDYYQGIERMSKEVTLTIPISQSTFNEVKIYAQDSYGRTSAQCIIIKNSQ